MNSAVTELWDEWVTLPQEDEETDSSELAGLVAALPFKKKTAVDMVSLGTSRLWALRRLVKLWKNSKWKLLWNAAASISVPPSMKGQAELSLPQSLYDTITSYDVASYDVTPYDVTAHDGGYRQPGARQARKWAWLRGVWGGCGSLYVPKTGYYLVIRTGAETVARRAAQILRKAGISHSERLYGKHELIVRNQQEIVAFLSKIGLSGVSLRLEDKAILRAMRDQANRMRNCDTANINKSLKAAEEQSRLAAEIFKNGLAAALPQNLRELAEARLEHPEESLSELGRRLSPPVTKSTVKYRWQRLQNFIQGLTSGPDS